MILGLGIDLVEIPRLEASIQRFGDRFLHRIYTPEELRYCNTKRHSAQSLAARFAAKEAAAKALGTGISRGVSWHEFEVHRDPGRPPQLRLHGRALALAHTLGAGHASLSLSHTDLHATAIVIMESETGAGTSLPSFSPSHLSPKD
jgi:holo-[acyl-carrier protein] synthase